MSTIGELLVKIGADASGLSKGLNAASKDIETTKQKLESVGSKFKAIGGTMTAAVTLPVLAGATAAVKLASDYNESLNKVDVAFKNNAKEVEKWAGTTLKSFGIAKGTSLDMAATFGDMATSMGLNTDQAADMSMKLVGLAGDLSSFKNISIDVANTALNGVFTGETESLKQLGIVMTQVNLQEYAMSQGIQKNIKDMTQAEQVQLRYNYILAKTTNAQGDFERTGGGAANQMRLFSESLKELGATLGENLLPIITPVITKLNEIIQAFGEMSPTMQKAILIIAGIAAVAGPVLLALGAMATGISAISAALPVLGAAFAVITGPIGLVVAAIVGLIALAAVVIRTWTPISSFFINLWGGIAAELNGFKDFFLNIWAGIVAGLKGYVNGIIGNINAVIGALNAIHVKIPDWVPEYGGKGFSLNLKKVAYLAEGGIVTRPTLAMVGEGGTPEAVIPLNSNSARSVLTGAGGSSGIDYNKLASVLISALSAANFIAQIDTSSRQMTLLERSLKPARLAEAGRGSS